MAKAIDQMTTEELLADRIKQAEAKKAAAAREAAIDLRLATQSIIDIVKDLRIPEMFAKIRDKSKNADLADTAILSAIAEAAGIKGITITKEGTKKRGASSAKPKTPEQKALTAASVAAHKAEKEVEDLKKQLENASQPVKLELSPKLEAATKDAEEKRELHSKLKAENKAKRDMKKK